MAAAIAFSWLWIVGLYDCMHIVNQGTRQSRSAAVILAGCCGVGAHHPAGLTIGSPLMFLQDHDGSEPALRLTANKVSLLRRSPSG